MKHRYCSSCRHSKYMLKNGIKKLLCRQRVAFGQKPYIDTDCTDAEECLDFDPERMKDNLNSRINYLHAMKECKIPLSEEKNGVLVQETLT